MDHIADATSSLAQLDSKTAIITGGSNGIGAQTVRLFDSCGAKMVVADLVSTREQAEGLIASLPQPSRALFVLTNILNWDQMTSFLTRTINHFDSVEVVVANAGVMESKSVFDLTDVDENRKPRESQEGFKMMDINLKGTLNSRSQRI